MEKELSNFIVEKDLGIFNNKTSIRASPNSIFKTIDAKAVHTKVISKIADNFIFADTSNLLNYFLFTTDMAEIKKRQAFFSSITKGLDNQVLKGIKFPKNSWRPKYGVMIVTEDEKVFNALNNICPISILISEHDIEPLDRYELVQVINCETYTRALERLPQAVFLDSIDEAYLERYLERLSGWRNNLSLLKQNPLNEKISSIVNGLYPLLELLDIGTQKTLTREEVEQKLGGMNDNIFEQLKAMTISGESLFTMLSKNSIPKEVNEIIRKEVIASNLPSNVFTIGIPLKIDEEELENLINKQNAKENSSIAEKIKARSNDLIKIPDKLRMLEIELLLYDFEAGISRFSSGFDNLPSYSDDLSISNSKNLFLVNAKPISFSLNDQFRCSILTGANSGGKTTLLEHVIQLISLFQLGLLVSGEVKLPLFSEVYYFAKNKGSMNKGAFETLLTQMAQIKPGKNTLILADEIESVTEPGVAGAIVSASAQYFIEKNCYMIIATHLGQEIQKSLPNFARIDGIEAKGLDENFELIVDHNPILGRLANSTPELIVERMANAYKEDYFKYLHSYIQNMK